MSPVAAESALESQLAKARSRTDELFDLLVPGALYDRPISQRHRLIFYLGHLEAFDWNLVCSGFLGMRSFDPVFDKLFEFGIDPPPGQEPNDQPTDWPSVSEVMQYSAEVRTRVDHVIDDVPDHRLRVALEHRLMHAETLAYLLHCLPYDRKHSIPAAHNSGASPLNPMLRIRSGTATLGQSPDKFGWDNEFPQRHVDVAQFSVSRYKITNGDYLNFVQAGAAPPHFWVRQNREWFYRGMFEFIPLPLDWPVYVTQNEASAYAKWAGASLMSEPQFHRAAEGAQVDIGNSNFRHWDPVSVTAYNEGESTFGVAQLIGNGWEWTSTPFGPFEGFQSFDFYPGYSKNFFDNEHFVLKGASPRTDACFLRPSFRNWFRGDYPYVYAGFRLVQN